MSQRMILMMRPRHFPRNKKKSQPQYSTHQKLLEALRSVAAFQGPHQLLITS